MSRPADQRIRALYQRRLSTVCFECLAQVDRDPKETRVLITRVFVESIAAIGAMVTDV